MTYALFGSAAHRYDWHTPPHHYQDDHAFVISHLPRPPSRILDAGCGTGVFLERILLQGFDASGFDASLDMVSIARTRTSTERVSMRMMQQIEERETYDGIVSLSWSFNYLDSLRQAQDVLMRFLQALKDGGMLVLQIAHAPNATGALNEDREVGPTGELDDILLLYQFQQIHGHPEAMNAHYVYGCKSQGELWCETHKLRVADANQVARAAAEIGFEDVQLIDSYRGEPFARSVSPFLLARKK